MDYGAGWEFLDVADLLDRQLQQEATMMANAGPFEKPFGPVLRRQMPFMPGSDQGCAADFSSVPDEYLQFLGIHCGK